MKCINTAMYEIVFGLPYNALIMLLFLSYAGSCATPR